jgi:thiol-disulfide isomerase/thioredoxin
MNNQKKENNKIKSQVDEKNVEVVEEEETSPWYVFCSTGCGFCKKVEPVYEELNASGKYPQILKLDLAEPDNQGLAKELKEKYNVQCGTPWFINAETGKGVCGFREKDVLIKWLNGEDIPVPARPKGPIPRPPLHGASNKDVKKWKKEYGKWTKENEHLPKIQTADEILARPRPKTEPPKPPQPNSTDKELDEWGKEYDKWAKENDHLPNLQPVANILQRLKARNQGVGANNVPPVKNVPPFNSSKINTLEAKVTALEVKIDKIMGHFGVK